MPHPRWPRTLLGATLLAPSLPAVGQGPPGSPLIQSVTVTRHGIFDSTEATAWVPRLINRLHRTTRASVVRRELLFRAGDRFNPTHLEESARNLRALGLFRRVDIDTATTPLGLVARVTTRDGWSTALGATIQQGSQGVAWAGELLEQNFLGTGSRLLAKVIDDFDRTTVQLEFSRPRLIAERVDAALLLEHRNDGRQYDARVIRPFRSLSERFGGGLSVRLFDGRLLGYVAGMPTPRDTADRRAAVIHGYLMASQRADPRGYLRIGATLRARQEERTARDPALRQSAEWLVALGPSLEWRRVRYRPTRGFEHLALQEDVDLGLRLRAELLLAPTWLGSHRTAAGSALSFRIGASLPTGFALLEGRIGGLFSRGEVDSGTARIGGTISLWPGNTRHRLMIHMERSWARQPALGEEFDLGYTSGPRGFRAHSFTGDRAWFGTTEYRYTVSPEVGKLTALGVAVFVERGGAWFAGSPPRAGTDAGIGVRLGSTRQADVRATRIDLVRRFANDVERAGWVLVVGKGFTFGRLD